MNKYSKKKLNLLYIYILIFLFVVFMFFSSQIFAKNNDEIISKIENYFNNINTLQAEFIQIDHYGNSKSGVLRMAKPGKIRFEYDKPSSIIIISDGQYIIFFDKKLGQINRIPKNKIPIKFLIDDKFSFKKNEILIKNLNYDGNVISITIKDNKNHFSGDLTLLFEDKPLVLRQWIIQDSQGFTTKVSLQEISTDIVINDTYFKFNYQENFDKINKSFLPE
ncbi:MAG: hypothetical protein CMM18_05310 [Rhodospirillaceae bacterium]|nr:hypothetical protein [Rhodospirillaceae bacterium]